MKIKACKCRACNKVKGSKREWKYRAKQQLANKFPQRISLKHTWLDIKVPDSNSVQELVNKLCK